MLKINEQILQAIVQVIRQNFDPCRILLFGSYARNEAGPDSDLDLLIVQSQPFGQQRSRIKESAAIWQALSGFLISKDILLYSEAEYQKLRNVRNHVVHSAVEEGRVLYGKI